MTQLRTLLAALAIALLPVTTAQAFDTDDARALTEEITAELLQVATANTPLDEKIAAFRGMMDAYADMPVIARFSLGVAWRSATQDQQTRYVAAFQDYIAAKYGRVFRRFDGQELIVTGAQDFDRRGIVVETEMRDGSSLPVRVEWQFSDRGGAPKLVDIIVEGISLGSSERQEISAKLDARRGNLDQLIADLPSLGAAEG